MFQGTDQLRVESMEQERRPALVDRSARGPRLESP